MEADLGIPSALFAPPVREIVELGKSQISFMNMFAIPLFQGVTDVMPAMQFCVNELHKNIKVWSNRIEEEKAARTRGRNDSLLTDGMFSPRAMSLATPSDTGSHQETDNIGTSTANGSSKGPGAKRPSRLINEISASDFQNGNLEVLTESPVEEVVEKHLFETEGVPPTEMLIPPVYSAMNRSSKPTPAQLQLSHATSSAPGLLDHPSQSQELNHKPNGISIGHSLVTDATVQDPPTPTARPESKHHHGHQRTSETTDGSNSAPGSHDWASQATSATTSKIPLSPSTRGTSITSNDSTERPTANSSLTQPNTASPARTNTTASQSCPALPATSDHTTATTTTVGSVADTKNGAGVTIIEQMKTLARKSSRSRFKLNFWKKKTGASGSRQSPPPIPTTFPVGHEEELRGRSRGTEDSCRS